MISYTLQVAMQRTFEDPHPLLRVQEQLVEKMV